MILGLDRWIAFDNTFEQKIHHLQGWDDMGTTDLFAIILEALHGRGKLVRSRRGWIVLE